MVSFVRERAALGCRQAEEVAVAKKAEGVVLRTTQGEYAGKGP